MRMNKQAVDNLNSLIERFSSSTWVDDAKRLRISIAEELVKNGINDYRKYINGFTQGDSGENPEDELKMVWEKYEYPVRVKSKL